MRSDTAPGFDDFVLARSPALLRTAVLLTGDLGVAQDLVQESLARSWPHWERVSTGSPEAYVRTVMVRLNASWIRRLWRGEVPTERVPARPAAQVFDDPADDDLLDALRGLPPGQRRVVILRYAEDLPVEEVARMIGCSPGTVKSQASKGLAALRARLDTQSAATEGALTGRVVRDGEGSR